MLDKLRWGSAGSSQQFIISPVSLRCILFYRLYNYSICCVIFNSISISNHIFIYICIAGGRV
ncbi:hypothetical protein ASPFODRAFT_371694 [Aspergillus luchuensis CBS 106.47]|uniref:Uncharacterized protein n=1 Tax=Aspergillus luchuensis (strain CBS 106.47) TaxID=1137211 RepID=A0A1M3T3U1_ASPLC|nr:hypothetical protein ASPFODRAFT_371694 [Aspergillus luchuensis CBS 106.47]